MNKTIVLAMLAIAGWSITGCGGPGEPVNRSSELRNRSGNPPPRDGDAQQPPTTTETPGDGSGEIGDPGSETDMGESEPDSKKSNSEARQRPPTGPIVGGRRLPPGLSRATGGRKPDDKTEVPEEPKETEEAKTQPPADNNESADNKAVEDDDKPERRWTFFERANFAFSTGNETEGFQYLYAHAVAEENALDEHPHGWYDGMSEPRVGLRWGVAVDYDARKFSGEPPKFDNDEVAAAGGSNNASSGAPGSREVGDRLPGGGAFGGGNPGPRGGASNAPSAENPKEQLAWYTSEFGERFLQRIAMRRTHDDQYWGSSLAEIDDSYTFEGESRPSDRPTRQRPEPPTTSSGGSGLGLDDGGGGGGNEQEPSRPQAPTAPNRDDNRDGKVISGFEPEFRAAANSLSPGVTMLGVGSVRDMLAKARLHGIDLLAVFDVSVAVSSRDEAKNSTLLALYNVKTGEKIGSTRRLNQLAYNKAVSEKRPNPIEEELDSVFQEKADKDYKAKPFPSLSSEVARKRVESLIAEKYSNPLPVLAEIRNYLTQDLIAESDFVVAAEALIGEEKALLLVDPDVTRREEALKQWLPGNFRVDTSEADFR